MRRFQLPLLGSNQDSPDPESGVLPVTPRGSFLCHGAEGDRTPDLCSAIAALSQLSYSPVVARVPPRSRETYRLSPTDVNQTQPRSPSIGVTGSLESPSLQGPNPISPSPACPRHLPPPPQPPSRPAEPLSLKATGRRRGAASRPPAPSATRPKRSKAWRWRAGGWRSMPPASKPGSVPTGSTAPATTCSAPPGWPSG